MGKRFISSLLAVTMAASLAAGCGSASSDGNGTDTAGSGTDTASAGTEVSTGAAQSDDKYSEENPYHLTFAYIEFYQQDDAARTAVQDAINDYMIPNYHIEVELLPMESAEYQRKAQLMMSGGDAVDVLPIQATLASSWINMGGIYDMIEFMDTEEGQAIVDALGEELAYAGSMNGILYGFPANKEYVELGGLCMRADICDELGITEEYGLEKDKDEYDGKIYDWSVAGEIFARVKEAYPDMVPFYLNQSSQINRFVHYDILSDNFGVIDWESDPTSTTVVNKYETETYKEVVTMLADWYDKGYIFKDAQIDIAGSSTMMKAGNTFSYTTAIKPGFLAEAEAANGCECYVMYMGTGIESDEGTRSVLFTGNACLYNTGISTNSEDPAMAFKFISALYTDPVLMNLWQYGIEGVNYQVLDDGTAYYAEGENSSNYKYHQNSGWSMGNQMISYVWNDGTKHSTQVTALNNALNNYRAALETGSVGVANVESTLKQLNDALYAAGLQDVMDEKQAQLDACLAKQQ